MGVKDDDMITELLTKLYTMQEDTGAKPKTTEEEKKQKAETVATMGTGRKAQAKGSRFLELRSTIVGRLKDIHSKLQETKELENAGYGGDTPTRLIKLQAEVREEIRQATEEWKELDAIYKKEARKKKSKFTPEELETQQELVQRLAVEIEKIKEAQMAGFARNRPENDAAASILNSRLGGGGGGSTSINPVTGKPMGGGSSGPGVSLTDGQRTQIQLLEERDADFDRQLDEIGDGIADLAEIAALQGEEVKVQNAMLDNLNDKVDRINDRVSSVNGRMKETLEEVGRSSDKLIVDIICIVLAIGFAAVFYNIYRNSN
mmetsp:Transcript_13025/g.19215  ORF Transcript_13025/g.19215 Transcript_13025/m.19215 type:complete len:318 (-) Transcript_13025:210-1163(-)|eukprot:CAMPEP_0194039720 /NCGR_PEP_ID=MMETSP0009_2-20130614/11838_1 /TAXON_ID=210454 /ORGANISM="Grammatophora oceanica, Strain CCMP 410" /LENGTH=317 /DNA_ID=CAMNT_0038682651 /DNA_START=74 /DNA_END=1027 /DNA_ORIENTATION=-